MIAARTKLQQAISSRSVPLLSETREEIGAAVAQISPVRSRSLALERVKQFHLEFMEIADIPRHHRQPMNASRGGDHRILEQRIRLPVLEARPFPKSRHVHRQDTVAVDDTAEPGFQFRRFRRVLLARPLDTGLNFSGRDGGSPPHDFFGQ